MTETDFMAVPEQNLPSGAEQQVAAQFARKQKWKEQPNHRYTPEELRRMAEAFGPFTLETPPPMEMEID